MGVWVNTLVSSGYVKVLNTPTKLAIDANVIKFTVQKINSIWKKYITYHDNLMEVVRNIKCVLQKMEKLKQIKPGTAELYGRRFDTLQASPYYLIPSLLALPISKIEEWNKKRISYTNKIMAIVSNIANTIQPSILIKPLDCMIHATLQVFKTAQLVYHSNAEKINFLNINLFRAFVVYKIIRDLIEDLNPDAESCLNTPDTALLYFESIDNDLKILIDDLSPLSNELNLYPCHDNPNTSLHAVPCNLRDLISLFENLKILFHSFSYDEYRSYVLPVIKYLGITQPEKICGKEKESQFMGECLHYTSWLLSKINILEMHALITILSDETNMFYGLIQDNLYRDVAIEFGDLSFLKPEKFVPYFIEINKYVSQLTRILINLNAYLYETKGSIDLEGEQWLNMLATLENIILFKPDHRFFEKIIQGFNRAISKDSKPIDFSLFIQKSDKHKNFFELSSKFCATLFLSYDKYNEYLRLAEACIPLLNATLVKKWKAKKIIEDLESSDQKKPRRRTNKSTTTAGSTRSSSSAVTVESDEETSAETEVAPLTESLKPHPIIPCLIPVINLRTCLRGLYTELTHSKISQIGKEQIVNSLYYTTHIAEMLERYADEDKWDDTMLLSFLSKCTLLLEQTLKYVLLPLNDAWSDEEKKILSGHDLMELWKKYSIHINDPIVLNAQDTRLLTDLCSMTPKTSRYPLNKGSSLVLSSFIVNFSTNTELFMNDSRVTRERLSSQNLQNLRIAGTRLIEISLNIWKNKAGNKSGLSLELPNLPEPIKDIVDLKPTLNEQSQLILNVSREIRSHIQQAGEKLITSFVGEYNLKERSSHFKDCFANVEGALYSLSELLEQVDISAVPYSAADAILLHSTTLLEQTALALISQLDIRNPQLPEQHILMANSTDTERPWKYTHNLTDFLSQIGCVDDKLKLTDNQTQLICELTEFLSFANHYPSTADNVLTLSLDNIRKCCELKRKITLNQGFLYVDEGKWCRQKFGPNHQTWIQQIDRHILSEINEQIFPRVSQMLEIAHVILKKINQC